MSRTGKIASGLARIFEGLSDDSSHSAALTDQQRYEALGDMRSSIRQLRRETDNRERELGNRWQRVLDLKRRGRDQLAYEEIRTYRHEETMLAKMFAVLGGQERVYSMARALRSINAFKEAVSTFVHVSQLTENPNMNVEAEVDRMMMQFEDSVAQFEGAEAEPHRTSESHDPALDELLQRAEREVAHEDRQEAQNTSEPMGDVHDAAFDEELERRLQSISRDRRQLNDSMREL